MFDRVWFGTSRCSRTARPWCRHCHHRRKPSHDHRHRYQIPRQSASVSARRPSRVKHGVAPSHGGIRGAVCTCCRAQCSAGRIPLGEGVLSAAPAAGALPVAAAPISSLDGQRRTQHASLDGAARRGKPRCAEGVGVPRHTSRGFRISGKDNVTRLVAQEPALVVWALGCRKHESSRRLASCSGKQECGWHKRMARGEGVQGVRLQGNIFPLPGGSKLADWITRAALAVGFPRCRMTSGTISTEYIQYYGTPCSASMTPSSSPDAVCGVRIVPWSAQKGSIGIC